MRDATAALPQRTTATNRVPGERNPTSPSPARAAKRLRREKMRARRRESPAPGPEPSNVARNAQPAGHSLTRKLTHLPAPGGKKKAGPGVRVPAQNDGSKQNHYRLDRHEVN